MLNNIPCTINVDSGAEHLVILHDVVLWATLDEVDCECHPLIMGEDAYMQPIHVV